MKLIIFAGGSGRRLWPISRQKSPKQFEPIIGEKSTLQLAVERVESSYGIENIFISTNEKYLPIIAKQLPHLPKRNLIGEPARRDLAAAVGLAMTHLAKTADSDSLHQEPVAILWGDNYMERVENFLPVLKTAETLVRNDQGKIIFIGETPRFANNNIGWIGLGDVIAEQNGLPAYRFESLTYRPAVDVCNHIFANQTHVWNTGYFVTTIGFVQELYGRFQPEITASLGAIGATIGQHTYQETLHQYYPTLPKISFDDAILVHIPPTDALVLHSEMGWSDPGTLYALKEAINPDEKSNVLKGLVIDKQSSDCLIYNYENDKLVVGAGLEGMIVVNTKDALVVVPKDKVPLIKQIVNGLEGTELESYS